MGVLIRILFVTANQKDLCALLAILGALGRAELRNQPGVLGCRQERRRRRRNFAIYCPNLLLGPLVYNSRGPMNFVQGFGITPRVCNCRPQRTLQGFTVRPNKDLLSCYLLGAICDRLAQYVSEAVEDSLATAARTHASEHGLLGSYLLYLHIHLFILLFLFVTITLGILAFSSELRALRVKVLAETAGCKSSRLFWALGVGRSGFTRFGLQGHLSVLLQFAFLAGTVDSQLRSGFWQDLNFSILPLLGNLNFFPKCGQTPYMNTSAFPSKLAGAHTVTLESNTLIFTLCAMRVRCLVLRTVARTTPCRPPDVATMRPGSYA